MALKNQWRKTLGLGLLVMLMVIVALPPQPMTGHAQEGLNEKVYAYTSQRTDGNRFAEGRGALPDAHMLDIALDGHPAWLVAAPLGDRASVWVAVLEDGHVQAFHVEGATATPLTITPNSLPPGMPPVLRVSGGIPSLVLPPWDAEPSLLTAPLVLDEAETLAFIDRKGDVVLWREEGEVGRVAVNAMQDARLLLDETGQILVITGPTDAYAHGVLGDAIEGSGLVWLNTGASPTVTHTVTFEVEVIESLAPIWADLSGDGQREVVVTTSNAQQGAQLVIPDTARSAPVGSGYRWRHQIAVAPFGPEGELELVDVLTPHIGGVVEFFRLDVNRLELVASVPGFSSHALGSRNLDMALAGDFDGDGHVELLLPTQAGDEMGAIRRTATGAEVAWRVPLGGRISTNLAATTLPTGGLLVGVGRADGVLRLWLIQP